MSGVALWVLVVILGGCGSTLRLLVDEAIRLRSQGAFPTGILIVNGTAALTLGVLTGAALPHDASLLASTAFVGAYSTFSTWMLDTVNAAARRLIATAATNVAGGLALGITAAAIGRQIGLHM